MTNEQLATFICQGESDELIPILWDKVKKLLYMKAESFYKLHTMSCKSHGVELWDIKQVAYLAFLEALKGYKPQAEMKFVSFIAFPFKTKCSELLGLRTTRTQNEPLNNSSRLEAPAATDSDGGELTLLEIIADNSSLDFIEDMERAAVGDTVRGVVASLSSPLREIIEAHYFSGQSLAEIGESLSLSTERVRQYKNKALRELRGSKILIDLYNDYMQHHYTERDFSKHALNPENYGLKYYRGRNLTAKEQALAEFMRWKHITDSNTVEPSEQDKS